MEQKITSNMRKYWLAIALSFPFLLNAQRFISEKSNVVFFSKAAIEDITAQNTKAIGIFDIGSGEIAFSIPVNEFVFAKSLMQEHFNEKYMETEKFPKSTFQGKVSGFQAGVQGSQTVHATGKLTIHGITKEVDMEGSIEKDKDRLILKSKFAVVLADYGVARPQLLWQNIAEQVEVTIEFTCKPYEK